MHLILFNNKIIIGNGNEVQVLEKGIFHPALEAINKARICVVDADVVIAPSVEQPLEKKDSILVRKFKELYQQDNYVIQDEKIDHNLFQVIGIKEEKVREVYSFIDPEKVEMFIPYGLALRYALKAHKGDSPKTIVFVDDLGTEQLLTVFEGLKLSRTRVLGHAGDDILPEIKRSQIDFSKKIEGFSSAKPEDLLIIVNNQKLSQMLMAQDEKLQVEYWPVPYPALEGLRCADSSIRYQLPEEIVRQKRSVDIKKQVQVFALCGGILLIGGIYFLFNHLRYLALTHEYESAQMVHDQLEERLGVLDQETYRDDLKQHKPLSYGVIYLSMLNVIPSMYTVQSFKFERVDKWLIEMNLLTDAHGLFEPIQRVNILKNAQIKDIFINHQPGKKISIQL
ncbi:MAG: hypothetical protein HQL13_05990 [Candidatus Omnitrophica bacterium]|nr:hypothetical protein [Candidatus Omnitrophota bacterium]